MPTEPQTRHSLALPNLHVSLSLLYVGRVLLGMSPLSPAKDESLETLDAYIEDVTDELAATELLHQAAVLAGDVLPEPDAPNLNQTELT